VFGNLKRVDLPNGDIVTYLVDGQNRRVGKKKNGTLVKQWLYRDELHPVAELDGAGTLVSRFIYASGKNSPDFMIKSGTVYRILSDQLGSPRVVVNATSGVVAQLMQHDAFGNVLQDTNPGFTPFGFAGGLYDIDTGLVRFGARDYDASVGRWTAKDPIGFGGAQTNLYVYAESDPVNMVDPIGNNPLDLLLCMYYEWKVSDAIKDCRDQVKDAWSKPGLDSMCEMPGGSPDDQYINCLKNQHRDDVHGFLRWCSGATRDGGVPGVPGVTGLPGAYQNALPYFPKPG
jgi:RHS repeat-associated protein